MSRLRWWAAIPLASFVCLAAAVDDAPRLYGATAGVTVASGDGLQRLELPLAVLQASRSTGYADVRLFDAQGDPLPIAWAERLPQGPQVQRQVAVSRLAWPAAPPAADAAAASATTRVQVDADGAVIRIEATRAAKNAASATAGTSSRWLLDLSAFARGTERLARVMLDWPAREGGLSTTVSVEGSDDARDWRTVTQSALLALPGADAAPSRKHIDWPTGTPLPKYLRLSFETPLALSRSDVVLTTAPAAPPLPSQRVSFLPDDAAAGVPRRWQLDLQGRVPIARIRVHLNEPNTVASLRLEHRNDAAQPWQAATSFVAWRLQREGVELESPAADVPAAASRHWRLVADERTSRLGHGPVEATIEWNAPQLVFAARDGKALRLAVGRDQAPAVTLALPVLVPGYESGAEFKLPRAQVGALAVQTVATPGLPQRLSEASSEDRRRWMLWGVLTLAVIGLALLAWRLAKEAGAR
jgi:Protein of unknown function (DUF3999)